MKKSNRKSLLTWLEKVASFLVLILPAVLFFSYYPVISFGANETMNFELSLPMIWLVIFDVVALSAMAGRKTLFKSFKGKWVWLLFPIWLTISVVWSKNVTRGILTVGILWLIYFAAYAMWNLRELFDAEFRRRWWRWFFGSAIVACLWCVVQCLLDTLGVAREFTLMCPGCGYQTFGFPHPNGFAAEPQFMGNLLLAPAIVSAWTILNKQISKMLVICFFVVMFTLFLTLSRGAIFAFGVAIVVMTGVWLWKNLGLWKTFGLWKSVGAVWLAIVISFLLALNVQGVLAEASPTDDTYFSGVSKSVNQLTLGVVDLGGRNEKKKAEPEKEVKQANFDGYVEVSTEARMGATGTAVKAWSRDFKTALIGTGLGSASIVLYENGAFSTAKEIVNNEYVSLLLETGIVGIILLVYTLVLIAKALKKSETKLMMLGLLVAYLVSLAFFSGLANVMHIYLLPVIIGILTFKRLGLCGRK